MPDVVNVCPSSACVGARFWFNVALMWSSWLTGRKNPVISIYLFWFNKCVLCLLFCMLCFLLQCHTTSRPIRILAAKSENTFTSEFKYQLSVCLSVDPHTVTKKSLPRVLSPFPENDFCDVRSLPWLLIIPTQQDIPTFCCSLSVLAICVCDPLLLWDSDSSLWLRENIPHTTTHTNLLL